MGNLKDAIEGSYTESEYNQLMEESHMEMHEMFIDLNAKIDTLQSENDLLKELLLEHNISIPSVIRPTHEV